MDLQLKSILLSGDTGFLGRTLKSALEPQDTRRIIGLSTIRDDQEKRIDLRFLFRLPPDFSSDLVIHTAGKAHSVPQTEEEKQAFYNVNLEGTKNLCSALEGLDQLPKSFVFISTVAVYGIDKGEQISEGHPLNGNTPYAKSKILAEEWLRRWAEEHDVKLSILRLPLIAGSNPPGNLGAMVNGIKSGKYLSIGKANARKSIVWAEDIARIIPTLAEKGGIYNLTDDYHPTFGELERAISEALNKKKSLKIPYWAANGLAKAGDVIGNRFPINSDKLKKITSTLTYDDSKARKELGWNPTPVLSRIADIV